MHFVFSWRVMATQNLCLDGVGLLEQVWKLALLRLEVTVAANVLLVDENIWYGALLGHLLERILDCSAIV